MPKTKVKQLVPGAEGQVLKTVSGVPAWAAESAGGLQSVGSPAISKVEAISLSGPASYGTGGFTATFTNLATIHRAIICLLGGTTIYVFRITAKSTNQVTIKAFRAVNSHTHTFTPTAHNHTFTPTAHGHTFTPTAHGHSLTMNAHGHALTSIAGSGGLALSITPPTSALVHPTGNATRSIPAGSTSGVQNTTDTGTVGNASATGTVENASATGTIANASATGTNANTSADALEELGAGVNLSGVTLELLGFGV